MWIARALMALAVLATLGTAWASVGGVADPPARPAAAAAGALTDDDGDAAMFSLAAVGPGDVLTRCIRIAHGGEGRGDVALSGKVRGALADDVTLVVERGSGGGFGDCAGFRGGEVVYRGTLGAFEDFEQGEPWRAGPRDRATYRFVVTAPPALAATPQRASVDFNWQWRPAGDGPGGGGDDPAPRDPAPVVAQAHPPAGSPAGSGRDAEATAERDAPRRGGAGADRSAPRLGAGDGRGARGPAGAAPGGSAARAGDGGPSLGDRIADFAAEAGRIAAEGVKRAAFPLLLLLALILFLVAQNRIDSRDPKLALAPVHRDHDLPFVPFDPRGPRS